MDVRTVFSSVMAAGLTLAFVPLGCGGAGGAQEEPTTAYRPQASAAIQESSQRRDQVEISAATHQQIKACMDRRAGQWSEHSYAVQYDAKANEHGDMVEVKLRDTTLQDDEVEECLRQAIATITLTEHALRSLSPRPFSGGERMTREQRGPIGSSDSGNPLVLLGPFIVEAVGVEVLIEVTVGVIAAIGTLVMPKKKKPKSCLDEYVACTDTPLGDLQVDVHGTSVCETCRTRCKKEGAWPAGVDVTWGWQSCLY